VAVQELREELRDVLGIEEDVEGVLVASVTEGSPADKSGIRSGDVIVSVGGEKIQNPDDLVETIRGAKPGKEVMVALVRDGEKRRIGVVLGKLPSKKSKDITIETPGPKPESMPLDFPELERLNLEFGRGFLGVNVLDLNSGLGEYFGAREGVLVTEVPEGSAGEKAGMKPGDVITAVDGKKVANREELTGILRTKDEGDKVELSLLRKGKPLKVTASLEKGPFSAWMEGLGRRGDQFADQYVVPRADRLRRQMELERRLEDISKELEKIKEKLKELEQGRRSR
jgi:serine protease Do